MDMRVRVAVTYSAVCLPGRTAGMAAPPRFSCSDKSLGSSCEDQHETRKCNRQAVKSKVKAASA